MSKKNAKHLGGELLERAPSTTNTAAQPLSSAPLVSAAEFHAATGQTFGRGNVLKLEIGQAAGPFTYKGTRAITTELGETDAHVGTDTNGSDWGLPLSTSFVSQVEDSALKVGDSFLILRDNDVKKKKGKGKGNPMAIYRIKIVTRSGKKK